MPGATLLRQLVASGGLGVLAGVEVRPALVARLAPEDMTLVHNELDGGNYRRTFTVHTPITRDGVTAALTDGVLRVTLPKAKEARVHKIPVRAGK